MMVPAADAASFPPAAGSCPVYTALHHYGQYGGTGDQSAAR